MTANKSEALGTFVIAPSELGSLISALREDGYEVIGPKLADGAIVHEPLESADDLPVGYDDEQEGGTYRVAKNGANTYFDYVVGPHSWKRYLFPPDQQLCQMRRQGKTFRLIETKQEIPRYAFFGVRSCDLHAMQVQDKVFDNGEFADPGYMERRKAAFVVVVNCLRPAATCFCASMDTGPRATGGYDLALTELASKGRHEFLVEVGSSRGEEIFAKVSGRPATEADQSAPETASAKAANAMKREMVPDVQALLKRNLEHRRWDDVAKRCLTCANCTLVCPTCFCTTVEDYTDLTGSTAERRRRWDSCFTMDFSYVHGGSVRRETYARYRQWMTHKLSSWFDQFDVSGCVGCGRCITWCPVGIDITEEARAIRDSEGSR